MVRLFAAAALGAAAIAQVSFAGAEPQQSAAVQPASRTAAGTLDASALPPLPKGRATVMGGVIRDLDPVRDQFKLKVFGGGKAVKIFFDPRTQVFRDGKKVLLSDVHPEDHVSVETTLDGTNIYALSIHMLSHAPEGETQGQVLDFDPGSGKLTISGALSREAIKLVVPPGTPVFRKGQAGFVSAHAGVSDLVGGDLVSIKFKSGENGRGVATQVAILATPGSAFVFSGNISALDLHSGLLVVTDPTDKKSYRLHFRPSRFTANHLHLGDHVRVTARFDGSRYEASAISDI